METQPDLDRLTLISGGQTGIDRAVLDYCLEYGIQCGGWCPAGRKAEDGTIPLKYPVKELPKVDYSSRTDANVKDSDVTVIIYRTEMKGGTLRSLDRVRHEGKPSLLLDMATLDLEEAARRLREFLVKERPSIVNFSGPRASEWPDGYPICYAILRKAFHKKK